MINQPGENEPPSSRPMQRAASVMLQPNKWLPALVEDRAELGWMIRLFILHGFIHESPVAKRGFSCFHAGDAAENILVWGFFYQQHNMITQ